MSWMMSPAAPRGGETLTPPEDIDSIQDEEILRQLWQQAETPTERRKYRARMYRLREERLREMMQNDEEALGVLVTQDDKNDSAEEKTESTSSTRKTSNIQVTMKVEGGTAVTDSISAQNVRLGGLTLRTSDTSTDDIINEKIRTVSKDRSNRYQKVIGELDQPGHDTHVSISKSSYSIKSAALAGSNYLEMKNKEVRDSVSPTRSLYGNKSSYVDGEEDNVSEEDVTSNKGSRSNSPKSPCRSKPASRKTSREERSPSPKKHLNSEKTESRRKISEKKDLGLSLKKTTSPRSSPMSSPTRSPTRKSPASPDRKNIPKASPSSPMSPKLKKVESPVVESSDEMSKLGNYLKEASDETDEIINKSEENVLDDFGHEVKMITETRKNKDGTEFTARTMAQTTKIVDKESDINEILIGNPDHEVIESDIKEEEDSDGNKIKIITETRRRPDGIEYTTKNVLKTSKIFDYDHPEDIDYCEDDELLSTDDKEETDEQGTTIRTITETRRKTDGVQYTTKKVYKTCKVASKITPSEDDEIIDSNVEEQIDEEGNTVRFVTETRQTENGEKYTHRQVLKSRKMTLSALELEKGIPTVGNNDEVINKSEKDDVDEHGTKVTIVTETRRRNDGSTYSMDYTMRKAKFQGSEKDLRKMAPIQNNTNIKVSVDDELIKEDVKEEVQEDGSIVKTIIERRKAKDGSQYLRHRVMKIPKMPEPELHTASLDDEVIEENVQENVDDEGYKYRKITERRRSSATGLQYTLRRMSKTFQALKKSSNTLSEDVVLDENVTEEELEDGSLMKTVIKRFQKPDGSVYNTQNIHQSFQSPTPIIVTKNEDDELIDESFEEEETGDGFVVKKIVEKWRRPDGLEYTIEKTEKKTKNDFEMTFVSEKNLRKASFSEELDNNEDIVISREETEHPEKDGSIVTVITEVRKKLDGTQYTSKTTIRSNSVMVPEKETSYVVVKEEGLKEGEKSEFLPSLDDEVVYVRNKKDIDEEGNSIDIVIETRKSKTTGEMYNLTKRVHEVDILLTPEGEKDVTKNLKVSKKNIQLSGSRGIEKTIEISSEDIPYGSVSALKNRFVPQKSSNTSENTNKTPNKTNTLNKRKFFEDAAKSLETNKSSTNYAKSSESIRFKQMFELSKPTSNSIKNEVDKIATSNCNEKEVEIEKNVQNESELNNSLEEQNEKEDTSPTVIEENEQDFKAESSKKVKSVKASSKIESNIDRSKKRIESNMSRKTVPPKKSEPTSPKKKPSNLKSNVTGRISPTKTSPTKTSPTGRSSPTKTSSIGRSPTKTSTNKASPTGRSSPTKTSPTGRSSPTKTSPTGRSSPTKTSPTGRLSPTKTSPITKEPKSLLSNSKGIDSPTRYRSPIRSGVSTPRDGTPNGRQCCRRHREASEEEENQSSPTRNQKQINKQPCATPKTSTAKSTDVSSNRIRSNRFESTKNTSTINKSRVAEKAMTFTTPKKVTSNERTSSYNNNKSSFALSNKNKDIETSPKSEKVSPSKKLETENDIASKEEVCLNSETVDENSKTQEHLDTLLSPDPTLKIDSEKMQDVEEKSFAKQSDINRNNEKNVALRDIGIYKKYDYLKNVENKNSSKNESKIIGKDVGKRYNPSESKSSKPMRKISIEGRGNVSSRRSMFENGQTKKETTTSSKLFENREPVEEPIIVPKKMYLCGKDSEQEVPTPMKNDLEVIDSFSRSKNVENTLVSTDSIEINKTDEETNDNSRKISMDGSLRFNSREPSPSPSMKDDASGKFSTGRPIDQGVNTNKIKRLERASSNKKLFEDLEVPKSQLPGYLNDIETITDVATLEKMLKDAVNYDERRIIRGQLRNAKRPESESNKTFSSRTSSFQLSKNLKTEINNTSKPVTTSRNTSLNEKSLKTISTSSNTAKWEEQAVSVVKNDEVMETSVTKQENQTEKVSMSQKSAKEKSEVTIKSSSITHEDVSLDEPYIEPLRHQKGKAKTAVHQNQSDVDKIVSPYGVGPTDENGLPLFGLRALKKRNTNIDNNLSTTDTSSKIAFEPTDSSGSPFFGLKSLKKNSSSNSYGSTSELSLEKTGDVSSSEPASADIEGNDD